MCIKGHYQQSGKGNHRMGENFFKSNFIQFTLHNIQRIPTIQQQEQQQQRQIITSVGNNMEILVGHLCIIGGNGNGAATVENSALKDGTELLSDPAPPCLSVHPKELKAETQKDVRTLMFLAALFTITKRQQPPNVHQWMMDKQNVGYTCNGISFGLKNE